ncbi:transglutaminase [Betaproteobacteria bacterium]|nr:transglutaminase [Betaproteobacteria bacterium]
MKRREFVIASAVLALLASPSVQAAKKQAEKVKTARKTSAKSSTKKPATAKRARATPDADSGETPLPDAPRNTIRLPDEPLAQWRNYDLRTTISLKNAEGGARLWLPLAQYRDTPWQRSFGYHWQGNFEMAGVYRDPVADMEVFYAHWPEDVDEPKVEITSQIGTQDRHFDITRHEALAERTEILRRCLQATQQAPTDGIVRLTAERAIGRIKDPLAQGKAIYDWVVENTIYEPQAPDSEHTRIDQILESGRLAGRSIEISLLFVALCRSIGIPARPVFGLRLDRSRLFDSLGASGELNTSGHCRAEFYSPGYSWVPVDPSGVRQAILGENLSQFDPKLTMLKKLLFGFWEMNWVSFNAAQDVILHGTSGNALPFLTRPVVETREGRFDDPASGHQYSYSTNAQRS